MLANVRLLRLHSPQGPFPEHHSKHLSFWQTRGQLGPASKFLDAHRVELTVFTQNNAVHWLSRTQGTVEPHLLFRCGKQLPEPCPISSTPQHNNKSNYSLVHLQQAHRITLFTAIINLKHHSPVIVEHIRLLCILDAPQSSSYVHAFQNFITVLSRVFHMHIGIVIACCRHQLLFAWISGNTSTNGTTTEVQMDWASTSLALAQMFLLPCDSKIFCTLPARFLYSKKAYSVGILNVTCNAPVHAIGCKMLSELLHVAPAVLPSPHIL